MEAGRLYQSLRGRLYRRLPVLAVPLGLLDWRQGEAAGTDGAYFYAPPDWLAAADTEDVLLHSVLHAMLGHIWERGNRELLMAIFARTLTKAPTAKALVYTLAEYVKPSLDYRCFSEPRSGQYGLLVRLDCEPVAMTAPFSANRADVEKLAAQLTVQQRPLAEFRLQFLSGEIPGVLPEQTGEWTRQDDEA